MEYRNFIEIYVLNFEFWVERCIYLGIFIDFLRWEHKFYTWRIVYFSNEVYMCGTCFVDWFIGQMFQSHHKIYGFVAETAVKHEILATI